MNQTLDDLVRQMREQRDAAVMNRDRYTREADQLNAALAALEGKAAPEEMRGPGVADMVYDCCVAFHQRHANGKALAISYDNIKDVAREKFPDLYAKIKVGLYNAIITLKKKQKLKLCPGGLEVVNPPAVTA